ncbi:MULTISPECIES: YqzE family protein [Gracilibacillus]|uniref:YqzE family protein n=1 Tax=Gracilibacillus TaxID=74385 RepID=UPI0008251B96|nr:MULTISPECIES: YqzE family protein [Gracilibacillus]
MANNEYIKYMTQRVVKYMDTPKEERKQRKQERKQSEIAYTNKWFGVLPFAIKLFMKERKDKRPLKRR